MKQTFFAMKRQLLLLNIILAFNILNAQEVYRFRSDAPQGLNIESSTATALTLHYSLSEIGIADINNGEARGQEIILKGSFGSFAEGQPNLPFENHYIAVPQGATVNITVKENGSSILTDIDLLPAATVQANTAVGLPKLRKDMSIFGKDADFPSENVTIAQATQIRGLDVVMLNVTPFRYNPIRKTLEVIYDMDIEVRFEGGNGQFGEKRYRNPAWDSILRDLIINSNMLPESHYYDLLNAAIQNREEGCEYLIISPDDEDILAYADTLRQFRTKQGILTKVVTTTECGGNDANIIKSYIKNAYDNWAIPPAAVMIFGSVDTLEVGNNFYLASSGIPGFGLLLKGYDNGFDLIDYYYSSDAPYADMNGDSIPDLALSRLPALTLDEYRTQVLKLIQYETNPPTQPDYYNKPIVTSSYEENKWFLITSQSVSGFYRNKLGLQPKNFYMLYEYASDDLLPPEAAWSSAYNTDVVVNYFGPNGQNYIAQTPDTLSSWRYMFDYSYLVDALNESTFLTLYRDHSSYDLWCSPWMESNVVNTLTNTNPTFLLSIGCDAALYSKVIFYEFSDSYWSMGENPMIYEFCKANVGALGGIGATTVTHSHFNDILTWGIIDNFWPNYMPDMGTMIQPEFTRPAYALVAGKLFLNQHAFLPNWWPLKVTTTQNVFHYLGETYLNLYTEVPQQMAIEADPYTNSQTQYTFTAEEGAMVCLSHGNDIIKVVHATGLPQNITLPNLPIGDHFFITITKQNRFRFEQKVTVISPDFPYVYTKDFLINSHDNNGQFDAGELVDLDVVLNNYSPIASDNGTLTLVCESPYVEITQNTAYYPRINPGATLTLERAFSIKLASDTPDQRILQFTVKFNENENTHEDVFRMRANAPIITFNPDILFTTAEGEPSTHIITEGTSFVTFTIGNIGHSDANHLSAALDVKAPFIKVETPPFTDQRLAPNEEVALTYELNSTPTTVTSAWLQALLDVQQGEKHICLDTILQYGCIFEGFETETLTPFFRWTNNGAHKWVYSDEDAYDGQFCFMSNGDTTSASTLKAQLKAPHVKHQCKVSFYYKTDENETLSYSNNTNIFSLQLSSKDWQYAEANYNGEDPQFIWSYKPNDVNSLQAKIDNICFPPLHTTIASAGGETVTCLTSSVELDNPYAYDCDAVLWTTEGDGHFEYDNIINPTYIPGSQDLANGNVSLTMLAFGNDTIVSSAQIRFVNGISLERITGDSVVNKYEQPISHYATEYQEGARYLWKLEPASAGSIYDYGNTIEVLWNLLEGDAEVTLTVTTDNGCDMEPIAKQISLIGTGISEWTMADFNLFPNPTDGKVNLVMNESLQGKAVIEVYNLMGEKMLCKNVSQLHRGETISLDLSRMTSGLYIIKLSAENGSCSKKVSVW